VDSVRSRPVGLALPGGLNPGFELGSGAAGSLGRRALRVNAYIEIRFRAENAERLGGGRSGLLNTL